MLRELRRFPLSVAELELLQQECVKAKDYLAERQRSRWAERWAEIESKKELLKANFQEIESRVEALYGARFASISNLLGEARQERIRLRRGLFASFVNAEEIKKLDDEIVRLDALLSSVSREINQMRDKEKASAQAQIGNIDLYDLIQESRKWCESYPWWNDIELRILRKEAMVKGERRVLAQSICQWETKEISAAVRLLEKELVEKEKIGALMARAASGEDETRRLAKSVKKRITDQVVLLAVCPYCGVPLNIETAHADHIYPVAKGGQSHTRNMVYVCADCNMKKKDDTLSQFIKRTGYERSDIEDRLDLLSKDY